MTIFGPATTPSRSILQAAVAPRIMAGQLSAPGGAPGLPSPADLFAMTQQPKQPQNLLESPAFANALLSLGNTLTMAGQYDMNTGAGLSFGLNNFLGTLQNENARVQQAEDEATTKMLANIKDLYAMNTEIARTDALRSEIDERVDRRAALNDERLAAAEAKRRRDAGIAELVKQRPDLAALFDVSPEKALDIYDDKFEPAEAPTPYTDLAKLTADYKNGYITKSAYEAQTSKALSDMPEDAFKNENDLRDEYNTLSKDYFEVERAYNRVNEAAATPSAAGDMSLIFGIMKMNDPASTVREGEYATAQNAGSSFDKFGAAYNSVLNGKKLTDKQRQDFKNTANKLYTAAAKSQEPVRQRYTDLSKRYKLNPENVVGGTSAKTANAPFGVDQSAIKAEIKRRGL